MECLTSLDLCSAELDMALASSFLETAPGMPAHLTVLWPWVANPTDGDFSVVEEIAADTQPLAVEFTSTGLFDGALVLIASASSEFGAFRSRIYAAFPQCPPYRGEHSDPVPHVTVLSGEQQQLAAVDAQIASEGLLPFGIEFSAVSAYCGSNSIPWRVLRQYGFGRNRAHLNRFK
jgi:2'-5' RNA ligase superfamily